MNKDIGNGYTDDLSVQARFKLHVSDRSVEKEREKCLQIYFDQSDCKGEETLMRLIRCLECTQCHRVPLDLTECTSCSAIICKQCYSESRADGGGNSCPERACRALNF